MLYPLPIVHYVICKYKDYATYKAEQHSYIAQVYLLVAATVLFPITSSLSIFLHSEGNCKPTNLCVLYIGVERKVALAEAYNNIRDVIFVSKPL